MMMKFTKIGSIEHHKNVSKSHLPKLKNGTKIPNRIFVGGLPVETKDPAILTKIFEEVE